MTKEKRAGLDEAIDSDTFKPTGKHLGMGCWGTVDEYKDPVGQSWAIKRFCPNEVALRQMTERGWTEEHVMRSEGLPLDAAKHHIVPRIIERDRQGKLYVGMPVYEDGKTLADKKYSFSMQTGKEAEKRRLEVVRDLADALSYLHSRPSGKFFGLNRENVAHGDVKPSNIFMSSTGAVLSDLGSSTCISLGGHGSQRGTHGDINYRAPECFTDDAKPSARADIWSLGAIAYELDTGRGIYEDLDVNCMTQEDLKKEITKRRKSASRQIRPFLKKSLEVDPSKRFYDGSTALDFVEKEIAGLDGWMHAKKQLGWAGPLAAAMVAIGGILYLEKTYEPKKLERPVVVSENTSPGTLYLSTEVRPTKNSNPMTFDSESITNLHFVQPATGPLTSGVNQRAKLCTDNRVVAYLVKQVQYAWWSKDSFVPPVTEEQQALYDSRVRGEERARNEALSGPVYPVIAKSIENALARSVRSDGKIDLEDTLAISRLGERTVKMAKLRSRSENFNEYRFAKNYDGTPLISDRERKFIESTILYSEKDVDLIQDRYSLERIATADKSKK